MFYCLKCYKKIKYDKTSESLFECTNCGWFNRFVGEIITDKDNLPEKSEVRTVNVGQYTQLIMYKHGDLIQYCFDFDYRLFKNFFKKISKKTGKAFENFLFNSKNNLTFEEKNLLYKFKALSIEKIEEKISYLYTKAKCISLLRALDF